jgi:hypothetical protein
LYIVSEEVRTKLVRRLSEFVEGKFKSEIVKNVTSVMFKSDVMFEYFRLKDAVHNSVRVYLSE